MRRKLATGVVSGLSLLACAVIEAKAAEMAPRHIEADSGRATEWDAAGVAGTRLDGSSKDAARWWDDKKADVVSKLLERPRRWSKLMEDWSHHLVGRVVRLGAPGLGMLYMMLMLWFSLVHAFPQKPVTQKTTRPQKPVRKARPRRPR